MNNISPQESRAKFIESMFSPEELLDLKNRGLYDDYVKGITSINRIYNILKEQGI